MDSSEIVIIGGGVIGCSIAYHLALRGKKDVTLVERLGLTHGATWHAAGLVGQLRSSSNLTRLMRYGAELYARLGAEAGWHGVGSVRVAASEERWQELKRAVTAGHGSGFDVHLITPAEAADLFPLLDPAGLAGATWIPSDGYVDPSQLTHAYARLAREAGVRIVQNCRVEGLERAGRRITAVRTEHGRIAAEVVVNATGMWGNETAAMAGSAVAVCALEHQYLVTEKSDLIPADLPTFRDPDGRFYVKPEASALAVGGWEDGTASFGRGGIPRGFGPELLGADFDRFEPLGDAAARRVPYLGEAGIHTVVNGPIPFSPDAEPLMGLGGDLDNLFHCCGFSSGIAASGGAGLAMANWIVDGDPGMDLWPFDVRRFGRPHLVPEALYARATEAYARYYAIAHPGRESDAARGQRRSPLHDRLAARGAQFGAVAGYERPSWYGRPEHPGFGRTEAWQHVAAEHRAVRETVAVIDLSSSAQYELAGPGALALLQRLATADLDVPIGHTVRTPLLNARGGIEADVTVTRLAETAFSLVTGAAYGEHHTAFLRRHADPTVTITDVGPAYALLGVYGPESRSLLSGLGAIELTTTYQALGGGDLTSPYLDLGGGDLTSPYLDLGLAPALALPATRTGEQGWDLRVPAEYARDLYDRISAAGAADLGHRALRTLRLEKHDPSWAAELTADDNPDEAGLPADPGKPDLLAGPALRRIRDEGVTRRLTWFATDADVVMHGGEVVHVGGASASVRGAGFGHTVGRTIFSAYLPADAPADVEVEVMGERHPAVRQAVPPYDPRGERLHG